MSSRLRFRCPCGQSLQAPLTSAGGVVKCPTCKAKMRVPEILPADLVSRTRPTVSDPAKRPVAASPTTPSWPVAPAPAPVAYRPQPSGFRSMTPSLLFFAAGLTLLLMLGGSALVVYQFATGGLRKSTQIEENFSPVTAREENDAAPDHSVVAAKSQEEPKLLPEANRAEKNASPTPMSPITASSPLEPEMKIAEAFVEYARLRDSVNAIKLIDRDLFEKRQKGRNGSFDSIKDELSAEKVLSHVATYSLESTRAGGGKRIWDVIGKSTHEGLSGIVLRYYSEPERPLNRLLSDKKGFAEFADMISHEELVQNGKELFWDIDFKKPSNGDFNTTFQVGGGSDTLSLMPPRAGYAMLLFDQRFNELRLCDVVNVLGKQGWSRSAGQSFKKDYDIIRMFGSQPKTPILVEPIRCCMMGDMPTFLKVGDGDKTEASPGDVRGSETSVRIAATKETYPLYRGLRSLRLVEIFNEMNEKESNRIPALVDDFHRDFPNDHGAELAIVTRMMIPDRPTATPETANIVIQAAQKLFDQWRDPFLIHVQAIAAEASGDLATADERFNQARKLGFESVAMYEFFMRQALEQSDKIRMLQLIREFRLYWSASAKVPREGMLEVSRRRWEEYHRLKKERTERDQRVASGPGMFGGLGGPGSLRKSSVPEANETPEWMKPEEASNRASDPTLAGVPGPPGNAAEKPGGAPLGPMIPPFAGRRGPAVPLPPGVPGGANPVAPGGFARPLDPQKSVTIKIEGVRMNDASALLNGLKEKLGVRNFRMSQQGQRLTMVLGFEKELQQVADAIDFGKVINVDAESRTIEVEANR